jgi:hypothetical protein
MHAFILLVISLCLLMIYGLIYAISRFVKSGESSERTYWKKTIFFMFTFAVLSGAVSGWLLSYV